MAKCEICGKGPSFGNNVSNSNVKTKRRWMPNIQKVSVYQEGKRQRMKVCTRCLRTLNKA
jgi:large subunit ribosomal protein L28